MVTFGALMALTLRRRPRRWPIWLAILIALVLSAALGLVARCRPLEAAAAQAGVGLVQLMIVSIGLSLALRYTFQFFYRRRRPSSCRAPAPAPTSTFGPIALSCIDLVEHGRSASWCSSRVALFLLRTRIGKATRAISDNPSLAAASGIDVDRVIRIVWVLAARARRPLRHPLGLLPARRAAGTWASRSCC